MNCTVKEFRRAGVVPVKPCPMRQHGLTLIEIMIAMTIGLLILLAVASVYLGSRQTFRAQEDNARLQETGRYALEMLGRGVRRAGFHDMPLTPGLTAFSGTPIVGVDAATPASDSLTVQYDLVLGETDCTGGSPAPNPVTEVYSRVGNELQCNGAALVADIEDVQILYGIDVNGDQSVDQYSSAPANWNQVLAARVCVQARSANNVNDAPQSFLNCAGALGIASGAGAVTAAGDNRLHRTFVATFNLRNRITNIPAP